MYDVLTLHPHLRITAKWTPGHAGVLGQVAADKEAKRATKVRGSILDFHSKSEVRKAEERPATKMERNMEQHRDSGNVLWFILTRPASPPPGPQTRRHLHLHSEETLRSGHSGPYRPRVHRRVLPTIPNPRHHISATVKRKSKYSTRGNILSGHVRTTNGTDHS